MLKWYFACALALFSTTAAQAADYVGLGAPQGVLAILLSPAGLPCTLSLVLLALAGVLFLWLKRASALG